MTTPTPLTQEDDTAVKLHARITNYLGNGGLFNPEMMDHDKVRDLLLDCRIMANCYMHYQRELTEAKAERDALLQHRDEAMNHAIDADSSRAAYAAQNIDLKADLSRWRSLAEELAGALEIEQDYQRLSTELFERKWRFYPSLHLRSEHRKSALARYRAASADGHARKEEAT